MAVDFMLQPTFYILSAEYLLLYYKIKYSKLTSNLSTQPIGKKPVI